MKIIYLIFISLFTASISFSQIVNVEKKRQKNENGILGQIALEASLKETGKQIIELKGNADIQYKHNANTFIFLSDNKLLRVDEGDLVNNGYQHLRYNYTIKDSSFLTIEAFGQYQYNANKLLQNRIIAGGGPRFRIIDKEKLVFFIAPLAMYEHEQLSDSLETNAKLFRLDSYASIYFSITDAVQFKHIIYYQPDFMNFSDYRISGETGLGISITKHFGLDISLAFDYDSDPPIEVQNLFYYLKNKIVFKF